MKKTKCMTVNSTDRLRIVSNSFPQFCINGQLVQTVQEFRYLGHVITSDMRDDSDIKREIRNMYLHTNMLIQRFRNCSVHVKTVIFKAYCVCLYGVPLWLHYNAGTMAKFKYCFHKCLKRFFGFSKYYSVTSVLLELGLPSFDTVIHNYRFCFRSQWRQHSNSLISVVRDVCHDAFS